MPDDSGDVSEDATTGTLTTGVTVDPTDPSGDDSITESGPVGTTGGDEDSTSGGADSSSSGGWTSLGSSDSSGGDAGMECGNGVIEGTESCDGDDLAGTECADVGDFVGGTLSCDDACEFDTSACAVMGGEPVSVCENINLAIPDNGAAVTTVVNVPAGGSISDVTVGVEVCDTYAAAWKACIAEKAPEGDRATLEKELAEQLAAWKQTVDGGGSAAAVEIGCTTARETAKAQGETWGCEL